MVSSNNVMVTIYSDYLRIGDLAVNPEYIDIIDYQN